MKHKKQARILAWAGIITIIILIVYMLYCAFTGRNFLGSLYMIIVVPVIIWAILFFGGLFNKEDEEESETKKADKNSEDFPDNHPSK